MGFIKLSEQQNGEHLQLHYNDFGNGKPVVLIHGWPSTSQMWEYQVNDLVAAGYRVISYDRRGFGRSSVPFNAYSYDALAADLNELILQLDLRELSLVGFSMGGGEVVRYLNHYGSARVEKIVLVASVTPYLERTESNPEGVPRSVFEGILEGLESDRPAFLEAFGKAFFGVGFLTHPVSEAFLHHFWTLSMSASAHATLETAKAFSFTDFREDLRGIEVPTLILHGDSDNTVPIHASGDRTAGLINQAQYLIYKGAPHGLWYTHRAQFNADLIAFLNDGVVPEPIIDFTQPKGNFPGLSY